jgi:glucose/arabinose dehydrogenase
VQLRSLRLHAASLISASALGFVACSGGDGDAVSAPPQAVSAPPQAVIESPAEGSTFKAGDTLVFQGRATDPLDGELGANNLSWWVDLHHDTHIHPFLPPDAGASGSVHVPTRGETSDNVWLRFHLKAVDSAGLSTEVTRDVLPQKAQITLASQPAGLQLTLDGQPVVAPHTVTGVVGLERDVSAADQVLNGRIYQFISWSDGGGAAHTITTPVSNTTYTAVFTDAGPAVNTPPTVGLTAPANNSTGNLGTPITLTANASDMDGTISGVQFFDGGTAIGAADTTVPYSVSWTPSTTGVHTLTARATDDRGATATSAAVSVTINVPTADTQPPTVSIVEPVALADGLAGSVTFRVDATDNVGVSNVEFQIDGKPLATITSAPYTTTVDTSVHAAGQHVLRARATDSAGNRSTWSSVIVRIGGTREAPAGITRTPNWVSGFASATAFAELPDGRILLAQQFGDVRVVLPDGTLLGTPLLSVVPEFISDRGLLGVVAHPQFSSNGFVYVYYTVPASQGSLHNRISRFTVSGNTAGGEVVLVDLPALVEDIHSAGAMHFGTDGKLYVAVGDNHAATNAPDLNTPFGKLLRFNDDGTIPSDNPFCTTQGNVACAIWARGLRNPFTFAVQPGTGRIHIHDVGASTWEEIDVGVRGANYGWPATEGPTNASGVTPPLFAYLHQQFAPTPPGNSQGGFFVGDCTIGGAFYPNSGPFPAPWRGGYFFTDFVTAFVGFIDLNNDNAAYSFGSVPVSPVGMLVTRDGALLVLHRGNITRFAAQ